MMFILALSSLFVLANAASQTAFSARLRSDLQAANNFIVAFDLIHVNIENAYNPSTGIFVCPTNGTYAFTLSILPSAGGYYIKLFKDSAEIMNLYLQGTHQYATDTVPIHCNQGQQVYSKTYSSKGAFTLSWHSQFSGFLIAPDTAEQKTKRQFLTAFVHNNVTVYANDVIPFDDVAMNEGGGYNKLTHQLTCLYSGIYQVSLSLSIKPHQTGHIKVALSHGNCAPFHVRLSPTTTSHSMSAFIRCQAGDTIYAKVIQATAAGRLMGDRHSVLTAQYIE